MDDVVQLVFGNDLSIMRVVMSSSTDWSKNFIIFHITYDSYYKSDYRRMAKWFGANYNQEVRFSAAVRCKKWPLGPNCAAPPDTSKRRPPQAKASADVF